MFFGELSKTVDRVCPCCQSKNTEIKDRIVQDINHSAFNNDNKVLILRLTKRKIKCKDCKKSRNQKVPFIEKGKRISNDLMWAIYDDFKVPSFSYTTIAKRHKVSTPTVITTFDQMVHVGRTALSTCISVDEFYFKVTDTNKYPCVISNSISGRILDIIASRKLGYLDEYFGKLSDSERNTVKYFSCDLNITYRTVAKKWFPSARIIADPFHVVKQITKTIDTLRKRYMNTLNKDTYQYYFIKKYWKFFLKNPTDLNDVELWFKNKNNDDVHISDQIFNVIKNSKYFFEIYLIYKDFDRLLIQRKGEYFEIIEKHLDFIINKCLISECEEIVTLGNTLLNWSVEIVNSFSNLNTFNISNGIAECNNNRIKKVISCSYGLSDFNRLRLRILFIEKEKFSLKKEEE